MPDSITLKFSCPDQPYISAEVLSFFADYGYNILESSQHVNIIPPPPFF